MQAIADLTRVQREVVTMWRRRATGSPHPFPEPLSGVELRFDAAEVAAWLRITGRGNNPEAHLEVRLHSSGFNSLLDDVEAASTLLLLYDVLGGPIGDLDPAEVTQNVAEYGLGHLMAIGELPVLLERRNLVHAVDDLAEAAYSGRNLLNRLVETFAGPRGPWAGEALTSPGAALVADVIREILDGSPRRIDPHGSGGLLLATAAAAHLGDSAQPAFGIAGEVQQTDTMRAACRLLAAHAGPDAVVQLPSDDAVEPHLALLLEQQISEPRSFFDQIDSLVLDLGPADAAVVIGPAELLIEQPADQDAQASRAELLSATSDHRAPLRYAARLPKGLSRFAGRRRLALWVFGTAEPHAGTDWTVYGEHADTALDTASRSAIASDVAATLTGGTALATHAFLRSTRLATSAYLRRSDLVLPPFARPVRTGGESLARIWELDDGLLGDAIALQGTDADGVDPTVSWPSLIPGLAIDIRGTRLPVEAIGTPQPGSAGVIGPDEVRDPSLRGRRAIDRLVLEKAAPRTAFTEPGDVVFTAEGGVAAFVDVDGGHVLQAPVRALRCTGRSTAGRTLHPHVAATDIDSQQGRDRRTWRLRTVPTDALPALDAAVQRFETRRAHLKHQLAALESLEDDLVQALAAGTLAATLTIPTKEN